MSRDSKDAISPSANGPSSDPLPIKVDAVYEQERTLHERRNKASVPPKRSVVGRSGGFVRKEKGVAGVAVRGEMSFPRWRGVDSGGALGLAP